MVGEVIINNDTGNVLIKEDAVCFNAWYEPTANSLFIYKLDNLFDTSGNDATLVNFNGATFSSGTGITYITLNGSNQYLSHPSTSYSIPDVGNSWAISCWYRRRNNLPFPTVASVLYSFDSTTELQTLRTQYNQASPGLKKIVSQNYKGSWATIDPTLNSFDAETWYFSCYTSDSNTAHLYTGTTTTLDHVGQLSNGRTFTDFNSYSIGKSLWTGTSTLWAGDISSMIGEKIYWNSTKVAEVHALGLNIRK